MVVVVVVGEHDRIIGVGLGTRETPTANEMAAGRVINATRACLLADRPVCPTVLRQFCAEQLILDGRRFGAASAAGSFVPSRGYSTKELF